MHTAILQYVYDAGRLYQRLLSPVREAAGLTQAELDILLFLVNNPEHDTASDIVSLRHLAKSNVSVGIKSLEARGLLLRRPDARDRRVERLSLTPAAAPTVELGRHNQEEFGKILTQGFAPEDLSQLARLMARIQQNISRALNAWS